jgi:hypothetical protein
MIGRKEGNKDSIKLESIKIFRIRLKKRQNLKFQITNIKF